MLLLLMPVVITLNLLICYVTIHTIVSQVSAHGCLNISRDFGPHGCLPGIKIPYVCIEAATVAPRNAVLGRLPRSGCLPGTLQ